ncbi:unconventional myosin-VIIa isoform X2 [Nematostella vectensis]|uniref:unconventional myosin-VIIa isoform X2 n=1 Tax=Nematostella vectensis TaxID=45351 RepID=UPI0020774787|nr:unconventional myosin-VIIa isoform X2 [Nematostella vectensis]
MAASIPRSNDLATLPELETEIILHELKLRYQQDIIYTYVGDILIAVNPFKTLPIYSQNVSSQYKMAVKSSLAPHIYALADAAYQAMLGKGSTGPQNQCCVISGESGAGKTESTKFIICQLVELSQGTSQLEQQILQVNPLLESFGNAQTLMNDNSSRFGKYIQLKFHAGTVVGAKISEYLLEKSRVAMQSSGEENFHIFYYLFAGLSQEEKKKYHLQTPEKYSYLSNGWDRRKQKANQDHFGQLQNAMDLVGFLDEEQEDMFTILSAVLTLGNMKFEEGEHEGAVIADAHASLKTAAKLLGVKSDKLEEVLTSTSTVMRGSCIKRRLKPHQAQDVRDATSKALYGRLFSWIVNKINHLLAPSIESLDQHLTEIGILDIFGFEHFETNSFEQACINLANEQLQFFFNQHIFMWEQEEYKKEGIDWTSISFQDNKPVLDLFLGKPIGILALLDEESHFPQSTDETFVQKLQKNCGDNKFFHISGRGQIDTFVINHYAGEVEYSSYGFLEKNRDTLPAGAMETLQHSDNELISTIFRGTITRTGTLALQGRVMKGNQIRRTRVSKGRQITPNTKKVTVGGQFKTSLSVLMEKMTAASPHFIRCIKPNTSKVPGNFNDNYVETQLKYTGVLETTRIRREGYAVRMPHAEFVERYRLVAHRPSLPPSEANCRLILNKSKLTDWHIGKTKVFIKYWHTERLTQMLEEVQMSVLKMQKVVRGFLCRRRFKRMIHAYRAQQREVAALMKKARELQIDLKQVEDVKQKRNLGLPKSTNTKYVSLDFRSHLPPPVAAKTSDSDIKNVGTFNRLEDVQFVDEGVGDFDVEEDDFFREPDSARAKFGAVATKESAVQWYQETQAPKLAGMEANGVFHEWFHGIITRRSAVARQSMAF